MRIYCLTCKEYILNTSDAMILGGPYNGAMFEPATGDKWAMTTFDCREHTKGGDLWCPRCMGRFLGDRGELLTEHGVVYAGQRTVDTGFSIVHGDGPAKGLLAHIKPSREIVVDRVAGAMKANQAMMDAEDLPPEQSKSEYVACPKCGKQYRNSEAGLLWYERHIAKCEGDSA